ncbi:MAG: hypothetical protein AAF589_07575 [Planctomycetota bacterium]
MIQDIFIYSTLIGGGALLLQVAMMFFGFDDLFEGADGDVGGGFDFDDAGGVDGDGGTDSSGFWLFEMISLKTLTAALAFFGLGGWFCLASGTSTMVALIVAILAGYGAMYSVYWTFKQVFKLETSGNLDVRNAIGMPAKVYIPIPADRGGSGKVQMKLQDRIVEYQAVTKEREPLKTGEQVLVVELVSNNTLLVERVQETAKT